MAKKFLKGSQRPPQKAKEDLGEEMVNALEAQGELMREDYRPFTETEASHLKQIVNEFPNCVPPSDDQYILNRLIDVADMLGDNEDLDPSMLLITLGMAYERSRSKGTPN